MAPADSRRSNLNARGGKKFRGEENQGLRENFPPAIWEEISWGR
jgi:hypothetical protein